MDFFFSWKIRHRKNPDSSMLYVVMPSGKNVDISYSVKCVVVENERIFGDIIVARQTPDDLHPVNSSIRPNSSKSKIYNLKKRLYETPDFMALNTKSMQSKYDDRMTKTLPLSFERSNSGWKTLSVDGRIVGKFYRPGDHEKKQRSYPLPMLREAPSQEIIVTSLVDQLLLDIYGKPRSERGRSESDSTASSYQPTPQHRYLRRARLLRKSKEELAVVLETLKQHVNHAGGLLIRQLRRRDYLIAKRDKQYDVVTAHLQAHSAKRSEDTKMRFSLTPQPGESGFTQWLDAMKMVARLQGGIPQEFRKRLWLTLAERHLDQRGVDWKQAEKLCFNEWSNPDDEELGIQIVKDLHRTGCSLFCGAAGRDNQAVLRRVLLGFARWNKSVGYCQGLNVLAALVLQVTDRAESSAVKVMIYLIEGVLPEGYFADNLRGLSIDMAVFRDLLRMRMPRLSRHLESLQSDAKDKATGSSYEPPLTNVFTMQWFLTLFCHCLPQEAVLRVWDLIFLEGDEVLLRTALAIWEGISDRIMTVTSADEFYSIMGVLTREMLEFTDVNNLIKTIVNMGPLYGVTDLREKHRYNITPWARRLSEDEDTDTEEEERLAVAAAMFGVPHRFKKDRSNASSSALQTIGPTSDRERLALDISTLKHQYAKLRERQRQAHIILSAACARQSMVPTPTSQAMNHLLVGKSALVSAKTRQLGPPPGAVPPKPRVTATVHSTRVQSGRKDKQSVTLHWKDAKRSKEESDAGDDAETSSSMVDTPEMMSSILTSPKRSSVNDSDSDSTSTELCDEPDRLSDVDSEEPTSTSDCYVIASDDDKSSSHGVSPIPGNTPARQYTDKTIKRASAFLDVHSYEKDIGSSFKQLSDEEKTSASIAMITDQIRMLSSSDEINSSPIDRAEITGSTINDAARELDVEPDRSTSSNKRFHEIETKVEIHFNASSVVSDDHAQTDDSRGEGENIRVLDRYDFSIRDDEPGIVDGSENFSTGSAVDYGKNEDYIVGTNKNQSMKIASGFDTVQPTLSIEPAQTNDTSMIKNGIFSYDSMSIDHESNATDRLETTEPVVPNFVKHDTAEVTIPTSNDQPEKLIIDRTFYSPSYVIGHLPITPATVNEKLSKAAEISPLANNIRILSPDPGNLESGAKGNVDTDIRSAKILDKMNESTDSSQFFTEKVSSDNDAETRPSYEVSRNMETRLTSLTTTSMDEKVPDYSNLRINNEIANAVSDNRPAESIFPDSSLIGNSRINYDYDFTARRSKVSESKISSPNERIYPSNVEKQFTISRSNIIEAEPLKSSSSYVYQDSMSAKYSGDEKKSPKTPDSNKSFSSGETMGPDSKNSSITTSPRSITTDLRTFPLDKSERSSLGSDSKTLTLGSLESEHSLNVKTKKESSLDVQGSQLDKSSPSTPISTDSLKNKSEISPKFVISSSSESCSPGKANKSSERSFSSELQSPVSANSIKYRANYVDEQNGLSESPMDISTATSPFYPIANPNQKTPSLCNMMGKQSSNGNSDETSPEQNSIIADEKNSSKCDVVNSGSMEMTKSSDVDKSLKSKDEYDSAKPFEKELAETLSSLPCDRKTNLRLTTSSYKDNQDSAGYRSRKTTIEDIEENEERYIETDTISPLPREKYETNRPAFVDNGVEFKGLGMVENRDRYLLGTRENLKPFERSCSSLERRSGHSRVSPYSDEFIVDTHKKRSSDILQDLKHLEAKTMNNGQADTSMLTRKTGYAWEDLKDLEARRQDNFSDSALEFSRGRLDPPRINVFPETRKSYVVEPKINLDEGSDSILKNYARKKSNGEPDDEAESKLGVWTKVKPRTSRDNGRRSSDRALKIIQENSAILHKILTCQAKKRLPDLEEISKEITISPINEEISKIFSPILEKMGLNEHEINEELARINFKDFDQMTTASGSEFDAKINDELSKLSLIDDTEIVDHMAVDDVISRDYLDTREAFIDRQINEELSKLLANYEKDSPIHCANREEASSSCHVQSEIEALDISSISTNAFSYPSSNESIDRKSDFNSIQETEMSENKFSHYDDEQSIQVSKSTKYDFGRISPRSDIDIYRELEKLDKISSGEILPSTSSSVTKTIISPMAYAAECAVYPEVRPSSLEYSIKPEKAFERSPLKSPYDVYKPYDFEAKISPRKTPSNLYSARPYEKSVMEEKFDYHKSPTTPSKLYDLGGTSRPILSKETLEFRVRYDDEISKVIRDDDITMESFHPTMVDYGRGASYYSDALTSKRLETERNAEETMLTPIDTAFNQSDVYSKKYDPLSPTNYSYVKCATDYEKPYKIDEDTIEVSSYIPLRSKNSYTITPSYQYHEREFTSSSNNPYSAEFTQSLDETLKKGPTLSDFPDKINQLVKYTATSTSTTNSREALNFRKASLSLGPLEGTTSRTSTCLEATPSPKSLFNPFPVRNSTRKPKELGLKLGLYSPSSPGSNPLKRS